MNLPELIERLGPTYRTPSNVRANVARITESIQRNGLIEYQAGSDRVVIDRLTGKVVDGRCLILALHGLGYTGWIHVRYSDGAVAWSN